MTVSVQSRSRVLPHSHVPHQPKVEALSIIDALVLYYAKSACIWFYEELDTERLIFSLRQTLNAFPQLAGQLCFAAYEPDAGHIHRQGRLQISHGFSSDPGVECIIAEADFPMSSILPPTETAKHWDATHINYGDLLDRKTDYALDDAKVYQGLPSTKIQFTNFKDSGTAIAVGMVHSLADAAALLTFMKDWAATNRALLSSSTPLPKLQPLFDPSLIDASAAGNIDARTSDPGILELAAELPVHRFDYWASAGPSTPEWALPLTEIPSELAVQDVKLGKPAPFHTWDATAACSHTTFFFPPAETHAIYLHTATHTKTRISHQDALLAHLWAALIRTRALKEGEEHFLDISIDGRRRLREPLPPSFIGSPILNVGVPTIVGPGTGSRAKDVADKAAAIRGNIGKFDGEGVAALLHEMCFELGGQRRWNCFLGDNHTIVTSWVGIGVGEVVFEEGKKVRWAEPLLPSCDGVVVVGEGGIGRGNAKVGGYETQNQWWAKGVCLNVYLRSDVMRRLMEDEGLRAFAEKE